MPINSLSVNKSKGFTLVELLVTVTILVILAAVGFAALRTLPDQANDSRRRSDIDSIAKTLESRYDTDTGYPVLTGADFTSNRLPKTMEESDYSITWTQNGAIKTGFQVCAKLSDDTDYCKVSSLGK